jgi:hypothetical protein
MPKEQSHGYIPGMYGKFVNEKFVLDNRGSPWAPKDYPFVRMEHVANSYHGSSAPVWSTIVEDFGKELGKNHKIVKISNAGGKLFSKDPFFQNTTPKTAYCWEEHDESQKGPFGAYAIKHTFFFDSGVAPRRDHYYPVEEDLRKLFANFKSLLLNDPDDLEESADVSSLFTAVFDDETLSSFKVEHPFLKGYLSAIRIPTTTPLPGDKGILASLKDLLSTGDSEATKLAQMIFGSPDNGSLKGGLLSPNTISNTFKSEASEYDPLSAITSLLGTPSVEGKTIFQLLEELNPK